MMFSVEQRDAIRDRVIEMAGADDRIVAGATVGSLALEGGGDRFSDLDLTFAVADRVPVAGVLEDWSRRLAAEVGAVELVNLNRPPTTYRVFLLADGLQFDLSLTPAADFRPAGPRFRLLFGQTAPPSSATSAPAAGSLSIPTPATAHDVFGWGVIYGLHARACIERGRLLQAEHYVGAVRDHALALTCINEGVAAVQARGYDDLAASRVAWIDAARVLASEAPMLRAALTASLQALMREAEGARLRHARDVADRLGDLSTA